MASTLQRSFSYSLTLVASLSIIFLMVPSSCFNPKKIDNTSSLTYRYLSGVATWYGPAHGDESEDGACGYGSAVGKPPFSAMVSAGSPLLFGSGKECGACYEVRCIVNPACSGKAVRVVITDECPKCEGYHFRMSGTAFGAMAASGQDDKLRTVGKLFIQYKRVDCYYHRVNLTFHVELGSNPEYFATLIEYADGDGDLAKVDLKEAPYSAPWYSMQQQSFSAVWKLNKGSPLQAPLSFRLTDGSGDILITNKVIPVGWMPGQTYISTVNF